MQITHCVCTKLGGTLIHVGYLLLSALTLTVMLSALILARQRWMEAIVGLACSGLLLISGATNFNLASHNVGKLLPTVLFLGFCLAFAQLCEKEKLFDYLGQLVAKFSHGNPKLLFVFVFVVSAVVTSVLSLDTTILLFTPIVLQSALRLHLDYRPFAYATGHLANTASLLLPISNLTNLLLIAYSNISFALFIRLSWVSWLVALITEFVSLYVIFYRSLNTAHHVRHQHGRERANSEAVPSMPTPIFAMLTVLLTLIGFVVTGIFTIEPFWVALSGCVVLLIHRFASAQSNMMQELKAFWKAMNVSFLIIVLALSVVVASLSDNGLRQLLSPIFHQPTTLESLLVVAFASAIASNVMNNLPAAMLLIPMAASINVVMAMAVLIGVNLGPNLSYIGSLANILWRRILQKTGNKPELLQFTWIGCATTLLCIVSAVVALRLSAANIGL